MTNPLARNGGISYLEIPTVETKRSAAFYGQVLGWPIEHRGGGDFRFSDTDGLLIGRFVTGRPASREAGLLLFVYVESLDAAIARVQAGGGEVVVAPYPAGDVRVARIRDPAGNLLGLWQFT